MADAWQQISAVVSASVGEQLGAAMQTSGALAVTLIDAADEPIYEPPLGTTPLWAATCVQGLYSAEVDFESLTGELTATLGLETVVWRVNTIADQPWERVWMDRFAPLPFGDRLWICPTHHDIPEQAQVVVRLDPGLAFGTGTHPTTSMCLNVLDATNVSNLDVIDYGCGSGILAIAALKLGANSAVGIDIDEQALTATRDNAARNGVESRLRTFGPDQFNPSAVDVVLANILAGPLVKLAPTLGGITKPGGLLVLSGVLATQLESIVSAYKLEFDLAPPKQVEDWICISGRKR
jgi:ribosomal protein L11 methyltransferase